MQRRLVLMRHAKSSWANSLLSDHDRPLNDRGQREAPVMGARLVEAGWVPQVVVSSDSQRTRETWEGLCEHLPADLEPTFTGALYLARPPAVQQALRGLDDAVETVMLLGHNPGFSMAVHWLSGVEVDLKTAHAALLTIDAPDWAAAAKAARGWTLVDVLTPH
ncbi:MAG: histidine phosphatase family protein [Myxococcales bacterium]|nr:histidine phosphatase family protein [Myxococcales bacterium]